MLYSKTKDQLVEKVDLLLLEGEDKYKEGLNKWKNWFVKSSIILPDLEEESNKFYRAFVGINNLVGVQIWERDVESGINIWVLNFIMNDYHEDNNDFTQIIDSTLWE